MAEAHMWAVDKPITATLIRDIVDGINAKFRELKTNGYIVDATCWFSEESNDAETLMALNNIFRNRKPESCSTLFPTCSCFISFIETIK
ncbi:phage tail sheath C-terminal domain-containing protein [Bacillus sp. SS-TM]